ncbi:hypothetical protein GGR50DRAFT_666259 [Xylaria sp. CBS 124048]|nr:hypothetical protein GGR50DRAFT_666259 [Xylaria sp. CBS 124048]
MASIGPTLPPHLAKRKRTPDDGESSNSPPAKAHASGSTQVNKDEVEFDGDSDSDSVGYGPSAVVPATLPSTWPSIPISIGLTPPPDGLTFTPTNADEVALDSDDDQAIGPSAPPTTNTAKQPVGPMLPSANTAEIPLDIDDEDIGPAPLKPKRIHGPAPPPAPLSERPPTDLKEEEDDDSDDDYGPALPTSTSHQQRQARALKAAEAEAEAAAARGPKRDDWMLAPPTAGDNRAADPTKLKARRFNSGPRASAAASGGGGSEISSIWTETPEEKRKRLENAVLGRGDGTTKSSGPNSWTSRGAARAQADDGPDPEQAARIQNFTEATRGRSLYEEHQAARARAPQSASSGGAKKGWIDEEDDDPSKRAFDKEKDMKLGGRISGTQRRELVNKAADFGSRFAKGKYL